MNHGIIIVSMIGLVSLIGMTCIVIDIVQDIKDEKNEIAKSATVKKTSWTKELEVDTNFFDNDED
jgi:hypothetical protein